MDPFAAGLIVLLLALLGLLGLTKRAQASSGKPSGAVPGPGPGAVITVEAKYPYAELINKWATFYGVDPDLVAAHMKVESNFRPSSINTEDPRIDYDSSYGLMQVQLAVAQDFGAVKDYKHATAAEVAWLMLPENNVRVGSWNIDRWQSRYPWEVAVQMYNVGEAGYNKGYRSSAYLNKVREAYNAYNAS